MITLRFNSIHTVLGEGNVIHLRIRARKTKAPGKYELWVDDITPLPGAEPDSYGCHLCGIIEPAKEDGSPPEGWVKKEFPERSFFVCKDCMDFNVPFCRVCGCTQEDACWNAEDGSCYWVEEFLCSQCADKAKDKSPTT